MRVLSLEELSLFESWVEDEVPGSSLSLSILSYPLLASVFADCEPAANRCLLPNILLSSLPCPLLAECRETLGCVTLWYGDSNLGSLRTMPLSFPLSESRPRCLCLLLVLPIGSLLSRLLGEGLFRPELLLMDSFPLELLLFVGLPWDLDRVKEGSLEVLLLDDLVGDGRVIWVEPGTGLEQADLDTLLLLSLLDFEDQILRDFSGDE